MVTAANLYRSFVGDCFTGFVDPPLASIDDTGEDQRLRLGAAFGEAAIDEKLIGAALCCQLR
jgi:hypothetical protein